MLSLSIIEEIREMNTRGFGIVSPDGKDIAKAEFDEIKVELKVTMTNDDKTTEKIYEIPKGVFNKNSYAPVAQW